MRNNPLAGWAATLAIAVGALAICAAVGLAIINVTGDRSGEHHRLEVDSRDARHLLVLHLTEGVQRCWMSDAGLSGRTPDLTGARCARCPRGPLASPERWLACLRWVDVAPCSLLQRWFDSDACAGALDVGP